MPQALAAAIVSALALTGAAAAIATATIALAITIGLTFVAQSVFGRGGVGKPSDGQRVIRVGVGSRIRHYGTVRVGGQLSFYESANGTLYALVTSGHGKIAAIVEFQLNGKAVTVDGAGLVTDAKFRSAVSIFHRMGDVDQLSYAELMSAFAAWTADHRQRGCSSFLVVARGVKAEQFSEVYEGGREPEGTATLNASLVYDPRKDSTATIGYDGEGAPVMGSGPHRTGDPDTWEYSDNWALTFADYLAHPDGYGLGMDAINWTNIAGEADISDQDVDTVDGRVIPRWRAAGSYKLADDERRAVVREFLKAGDGFMFQDANGRANILCGRWIEPTVHIPEKHIIGCSASLGTNAMDRANEVRVVYMEPRFSFTETEASPTVDAATQAALGRSEVSRFDCYYCPDHNQAKRIGKRILARLGMRWALTITTNLYGLNVIGERFITLTIIELQIINVPFEVTAIKIDPKSLNVEIGLLETHAEDFEFDAETEEGTPPGDVAITAGAIVVETLANLTLSTVQVALGTGAGVGIQGTWDQPERTGLIAQVQFRPTGATDWLEMTVSQDDRIASSGVVSSDLEYEVQGRHFTVAGRPSEWCDIETITPTVPEAAPSPPTDLGADGNTGSADLQWRNPAEANFGFVRIYRNTTATFGTATALSDDVSGGALAYQAFTDDDGLLLLPGTYYWWFASFNAAGTLVSAPAGPVTATVT